MPADVRSVEQCEPEVTLRAVVCDDDAVIRSVVSELIEERGGEVIAETDSGPDVVALVERFAPDLVVVDLGLDVGSGHDVLRHFERRPDRPAIVVFTAFDGSVASPAATSVVRKPGFQQLERALDAVIQLQVQQVDRRQPTRPLAAPGERDDLGVDQIGAFYEVLVDAQPDDVLLALATDGLDPRATTLAVRAALRTGDRLIVRRDRLVALLVGAGGAGAGAVAARLAADIPDAARRIRSAPAGDAPSEVFIDLTA